MRGGNIINVTKDWNPKQARLKEIILKKDKFHEAINLTLEMHSQVHTSEMSGAAFVTYEDILWENLDQKVFRDQIRKKGTTIAWNLWHLTRIEDLTVNLLIAEKDQVINSSSWLERMQVSVSDTGNAMNDSEISAFSSKVDMQELRKYRIEVGRKTQEIIKKLTPEVLKQKVKPEMIQRIKGEGGVTDSEDSKWLLDFWGKKTVAGIILMPITRHQIVHLNDSLMLKDKLSGTYKSK